LLALVFASHGLRRGTRSAAASRLVHVWSVTYLAHVQNTVELRSTGQPMGVPTCSQQSSGIRFVLLFLRFSPAWRRLSSIFLGRGGRHLRLLWGKRCRLRDISA